MRKFVTLFMMLMLSGVLAFAQNRVVTGRVIDDRGTPVPYATIAEVGKNNAVTADENGNYTITVGQNSRLTISSAGFTDQTVAAQSVVNVTLAQGDSQLQEVIITAQGIGRRPKTLGYSVGKVTNQELSVGKSPRLAEALSGKVSGLTVFNIDNSVDPRVKVVLRGYRSLTGSNDALIVIDGIVNVPQSSLATINPNDVESVTILKGGQAATLYGSAGVNGALIITTKRGTKGKLKVTYSNATNIERLAFLPDFQDKYGSGSHYATFFGRTGYKTDYLERMKDNFRTFENQQYGDAYDGSIRVAGRVTESGDSLAIPYSAINGERRRVWNTGFTTNNSLSFSGGEADGTYYMSYGNNITEGIVPGDRSQRNSIRIGATKSLNKLTVGFNAAYVQAKFNRTTSDFYFDALNVAAHIPISQLKDWRNNQFANPNGFYDDYYNNPYFNNDNNRQNYQDANISGTIELNYKLFPWLSINEHLGVVNTSRNRKNHTSKFIYSDYAKDVAYVPAPFTNDYDGIDRAATDITGNVFDANTNENIVNNEFQLQLAKDFGNFSNKLILGQSIYQQRSKQVSVSSGSIVQDSIFNVGNRRGELGGGEFNSITRKYGYYADLTTGWKDVVFFHASGRYDATSLFFKPDRPTNLYKFGYYGADVSFILTDALPSLKSNTLNYAKLRVGYNKNANDNIDPFQLDLTFPRGAGFPFGNTVGNSVGNVLPDANLKPEFVFSYEAGAEFQLFNNRVNFDIAAFRQKSVGSILTVKVPASSGFPFLRLNVGETKNWGYEVDLRVQIVRTANINWEISGNYGFNDNRAEKLFEGVNEFALTGGFAYAQPYVIQGQSYPALKATAYLRDSATGRIIVGKDDGYPLQTADLKSFGRTTPKHVAGLGTKVRVKDFSLAANAEYRGGNMIFHQLGRDMTFTGSGKWTENRAPFILPNSSYDDGTGKIVPNTTVNVQEAEYAYYVDKYRYISENFVTPGWFIKLRDVNLSYNFPSRLMNKTKVFSGATVGIYGRNLFTIVDKLNMYTDPEFSTSTGNGQGINDSRNTPPVKQFGFNVNLTF